MLGGKTPLEATTHTIFLRFLLDLFPSNWLYTNIKPRGMEQLMERIKNGDAAACETLVKRP